MKAVILAGGKGNRIGGKKALKLLLGKPLIYWIFQNLKDFFSSIYISVKNQEQENEIKKVLIDFNLKQKFFFIKDLYPQIEGPISGIFSALKYFPDDETLLILAVDQPLIKKETISHLLTLSNIFCNNFLIIYADDKRFLPFPGIYPCFLKKEFEKFFLVSPQKSLYKLFQYLKLKEVILFIKNNYELYYNKEIFININTQEDLKRAERCFFQRLKNLKM